MLGELSSTAPHTAGRPLVRSSNQALLLHHIVGQQRYRGLNLRT